MPDEHPSCIRVAGQQPPIPVGTAVNLSRPNGHGGICSLFRPHHIVATGAVRHPQSRAADSNCGTTKTCFCHQHAHLRPRGLSARYRRPFPLNAAIVRPRSTAAAAVADPYITDVAAARSPTRHGFWSRLWSAPRAVCGSWTKTLSVVPQSVHMNATRPGPPPN